MPDVGTYEVACDSDGTPLVDAGKLADSLAALHEGATVAQWLAGPGEQLLGTAVRARLSTYERRIV
ncbi:hypothetical protein LN042_23020 [Kitasatospora sp. RB6PN24]|uniref:hypothetical protein n=1 Tax=Kitasatospora humi TaxID=2893891 RepID=UPI001E3B7099|nr:hypothetical protein [Kitasatospora humi]MCC9309908.1 hypothetical protein [Kitasatospora humi]